MTAIVLSLSELMAAVQGRCPGIVKSLDTLRRRVDAMDRDGEITIQRVGRIRTVALEDVPKIVAGLQERRGAVSCK